MNKRGNKKNYGRRYLVEGIITPRKVGSQKTKVGSQKTLKIGTEEVVVTFIQRSNGSLVISDAWVKTI
jgi:hypothetical protein